MSTFELKKKFTIILENRSYLNIKFDIMCIL